MRRREIEEAIEFEQQREALLREQIEAVVLEREGPRLDDALRARLDPADIELLADVLGWDAGDWGDEDAETSGDEDSAGADEDERAEIERLQAEVERSIARQGALRRAVGFLESPLGTTTEPTG